MDVDALYARHRDALLVFLVRRTADTEVALDLWAETFAQAVASRRRYRGTTEAEAAAWLYTIAKRQLALYYRRGKAEQRAMAKLGLERPPASDALIAEIEQRAGLEDVRRELGEALAQPLRERPRRDPAAGRRRAPVRGGRTLAAHLRTGGPRPRLTRARRSR